MRAILLGAALACGAVSARAEACAPATVVRMVTREVTPHLPKTHFARLPKTIYRLGAGKARLEEARDPVQGIRSLIVIDEPDLWFANLEDGSGRHGVDPGPSLDVHIPIFTGAGLPKPLSEIEFGCEAEFVKAHMPLVEPGASRQRRTHVLQQDGYLLRVTLDGRGRPLEATLARGGALMMSVAYDAFETGLPEPAGLFAAPAGITFRKADAGPE